MWARQTLSPSASLTGASTVFLPILSGFQSAYGADPIGSTVARIRGNISLRGAVAGNSIRATIGIAVFNGLPTTANQAPANNPHLDWMWWQVIFIEPVVATEFAQTMQMPIDVKAMRRMDELGMDLQLAIQNTHPTDNLAYAYATSTLLALP